MDKLGSIDYLNDFSKTCPYILFYSAKQDWLLISLMHIKSIKMIFQYKYFNFLLTDFIVKVQVRKTFISLLDSHTTKYLARFYNLNSKIFQC